jgi:hypothetical protein
VIGKSKLLTNVPFVDGFENYSVPLNKEVVSVHVFANPDGTEYVQVVVKEKDVRPAEVLATVTVARG